MDPMLVGKVKRIKLLILDVDGVLTDGKLYLEGSGREFKAFHVRDGAAIVSALKQGLAIAWVSGRRSKAVTQRARELGIKELYQGVKDKEKVLARLMRRYSCTGQEVGYMGDDLADISLFRQVGFSAAVSDAPPPVRKVADYQARQPGGGGAVMEVLGLILENRSQVKES